MPPRKSDQNRSDARFVLGEDVNAAKDAVLPTTEPVAAPAPITHTTSGFKPANAPQPATTMPQTQSQEQAQPVQPQQSVSKDGQKKAQAPDSEALAIEDMALPKSVIARLAKGVLPPNTQIQGTAITAMSKSATVFINYVAHHANILTLTAGKKTIGPLDVLKVLDDLEMGFMREDLEAELRAYTAAQTEKRTAAKSKVQARTSTASKAGDTSTVSAADTDMADASTANAAENEDKPRATKKARVSTAAAAAAAGAGAAAAAANGAETEEEDAADDDEDVEEEEDEDEVDEEEEEEEQEGSGDETQDMEENGKEEVDEALDGDESD